MPTYISNASQINGIYVIWVSGKQRNLANLIPRAARYRRRMFVGLRPVIQILCHVLARGWGRWLRYFTEAKVGVKYRTIARIRWPTSKLTKWVPKILIYLRSPVPFDSAVTASARPPNIECTHLLLKYKERRLMTSQYPIFDRTDNLNPQWM